MIYYFFLVLAIFKNIRAFVARRKSFLCVKNVLGINSLPLEKIIFKDLLRINRGFNIKI